MDFFRNLVCLGIPGPLEMIGERERLFRPFALHLYFTSFCFKKQTFRTFSSLAVAVQSLPSLIVGGSESVIQHFCITLFLSFLPERKESVNIITHEKALISFSLFFSSGAAFNILPLQFRQAVIAICQAFASYLLNREGEKVTAGQDQGPHFALHAERENFLILCKFPQF